MQFSKFRVSLVVALVVVLSACSSSQTKEDEAEVIPPAADAGTDAVPLPETELSSSSETPPPAPGSTDTPAPPAPSATETPVAATEITPSNPTPAATPDLVPAPTETKMPESKKPDLAAQQPELVTATPTATSGQMEDYTVQTGDTLMKIAFEVYGNVYMWRNIYSANKDKISDPNSIPKGIVLKIDKPSAPVSIDRSGEKYMIKQGDTLGKISGVLYGTPSRWKELWEHNKQLIKNPNKIFSGFYLYYIGGTSGDAAKAPLSTESVAPAVAPPGK